MAKLGNAMMVVQILAILMVASAAGGKKASPPLPPSPAPAPAPAYVNLTDLLSVAGPFTTFLSLLQSTGVLRQVQDQANNTDVGVTLFVPTNQAFSSLSKKVMSKVTPSQKKAMVLAHVVPKFYSLSDFQNFSNPANTLASGTNGGKFNLNITSNHGDVSVSSGYAKSRIGSAVHVTDPVAVYQVGKVLLPIDIFGVPPPTPAPAPSPVADEESPSSSPDADTPKSSADVTSPAGSPSTTPSSASFIKAPVALFAVNLAGALMLL